MSTVYGDYIPGPLPKSKKGKREVKLNPLNPRNP